jgi:hypothetical protein
MKHQLVIKMDLYQMQLLIQLLIQWDFVNMASDLIRSRLGARAEATPSFER